MAPKTLYDAGEVQKKVTETAEKAFKTLEEEGWEFSESTEIVRLSGRRHCGRIHTRQEANATLHGRFQVVLPRRKHKREPYQEGSLRLLPEPRHHLPRALEDSL